MSERDWTVRVSFSGDARYELNADAVLTAGLDRLDGHGRARKHPNDPHVPHVAAEIAASRALADLARQLRQLADDGIAAWDDGLLLVP